MFSKCVGGNYVTNLCKKLTRKDLEKLEKIDKIYILFCIRIHVIMNTETEIDMNDTELEIYNDENDAELEIYNDENDAEIEINNDIIPSISLTNDVKQLIQVLIVKQINHHERQNGFFEELLRLWFGNNVTVRSLIEHKEYRKRLNDCKQYVCQMIAQYLPDRDDEIYSAYYSLKRDGKYEDHNGDLCTVRYVKDVNMEIL